MAVLVLRFTLVPLTVLVASIVQRRLGPTIGGRVVGLPLTTGPFLILLCLQAGPATAAHAAVGVLAGQLSVVGFCVAYAQLAHARRRPWLCLTGALAAVAGCAVISGFISPPWLLALAVIAVIAVSLVTWPVFDGPPPPARTRWVWETPVRMLASGVLVATLLGTASILGPHLAGVLATMPVILTVLSPATHRADGPAAAAAVGRGSVASMGASVVFIVVLAYTLGPLPAWASFTVAIAALLVSDRLAALATRVPHASHG